MKRLSVILFVLGSIFLPIRQIDLQHALAAPPPPERSREVYRQIEQAVLEGDIHYRNQSASVPFYNLEIDKIMLSDEEEWASAWLVYTHPQTGEIIPTESVIAIARWNGNEWEVTFPHDPSWRRTLIESPGDLMSVPNREVLLSRDTEGLDIELDTPISGYLLPWKGGKTVWLSQSLAHDDYITSGNAHYSFDFYISKTMFDIHASKAGKVWVYKDNVSNGNPDDVNYLVLQDAENPNLYQLYLHLAQNSIPPNLKNVGTYVAQGQFIGVADDTGMSTGHHLHFQVETLPYYLSYWGRSVDITFDDVTINGGRPRVKADIPYCRPDDICDQFQSAYISGNFEPIDPNPPTGDITTPDNGVTVSNLVNLSGWAIDNSGITSARFMANYDDKWTDISPWFTTPSLEYSWDLCGDQIPDGPISLALDIQDGEGNWASGLPGLRHVIKNYACPKPSPECTPDNNQVALFSDSDYGGSCTLFGTGNHTNLGIVGADDASSILVGTNVYASLFLNDDFTGRGETLFNNDNYLKDNTIGHDTVSSIKVISETNLPFTPLPVWPEDNATYPRETSLSLSWEDLGGASEYLLEFPGIPQIWQTKAVYNLGSLSPGTYSWRVKARNNNGESNWSDTQTLIITDTGPASESPITAPFSDDMESGYNGWSASNNWDQAYDQDPNHSGEIIWNYEVNSASSGYDNGSPNTGDLTSPEIIIPDDENTYYLRFNYLYETEGPGIHWDQRWVQLSVDSNPFTNLYQLSNDPPNYWLESPVIPLANYAGSTIRVRFHFETLDATFNDFNGWYIDNFSITPVPPPTCQGSGEPNDSIEQAQGISYSITINAEICPGGDIDYYRFDGTTGDHIGLTTTAQSNGSDLDTYIYLIDSKGAVLAENDDIIPYENRDSSLSYTLPKTDTYYIKVHAWDHPTAGGDNHFYSLHLDSDNDDPLVNFSSLNNYTFLPKGEIDLSIDVSDEGSGASRIDFYWHSGDWEFGSWEYIGVDWDGDDGWSISFDTSTLPKQDGIAFYAEVHDWAGNSTGIGAWNLYLYEQHFFTYLPIIQ